MDKALAPGNVRETRLEQLMDAYSTSILRMCILYLKDMAMAEDAAQDTFIKAYQKMDDLINQTIGNERAWLMRIAINTCKDYQKSGWFRHIDRRFVPEDVIRFQQLASDDDVSLLHEISNLQSKLKDVVLLYYYHGFKAGEIAVSLKISEGTVYNRLKKAQTKLRLALERGDSL